MNRKITILKTTLIKVKTALLLSVFSICITSCSNNDDESIEANPVAKEYLSKVTINGEGESSETNIIYDSNNRVVSAWSEDGIIHFTYDSEGKLKNISGDDESFGTSEVISEIHKAYEIGEVLEYDNVGNPTILEIYDEGDRNNKSKAYITYDSKPYTFYYTLDAAGIIDVLKDVKLQFYATKELILAKKLLPINNPIKAVIVNDSKEESTINVNYNYNEKNYPISSSVLIVDFDGYRESYTVDYKYK